MAAQSGRDMLVLKDGVAIAGCRETSITFQGEPVDITNKGSNGYRTLASFSGVESFDITNSGVWEDDVMRGIAFSGPGNSKLLTDITLQWGDGATMACDFYLSGYTSGGNHDAEETQETTLQSSGPWTYTPA